MKNVIAVAVIIALAAGTTPSAQQGQKPPDQPRFEGATSVTLVSVDVVVRDSKGEVVRGLTAKDFTVLEDGKPQRIYNFSVQEIAAAATPEGKPDVQLLEGLEEKVRAEAALCPLSTFQSSISCSLLAPPTPPRSGARCNTPATGSARR